MLSLNLFERSNTEIVVQNPLKERMYYSRSESVRPRCIRSKIQGDQRNGRGSI
jgi:hypothetical protein